MRRKLCVPTWKYNPYRHCVDVMHVEKNFTEHLIDTLLDIKGKSKDGVKAREDMRKMNIHSGQWITTDSVTGKEIVSIAGFRLSKEERDNFLQTLKNMKFPSGFSSNIGNNVTFKPPGLSCLKSNARHLHRQLV